MAKKEKSIIINKLTFTNYISTLIELFYFHFFTKYVLKLI